MYSRSEATRVAAAAEKAANERGLVRTNFLFKDQDHFNRLIRLVNLKYNTAYPTFVGHVVIVFNAEAILQPTNAQESYCRDAPFIPGWMMTLLRIEREWRRKLHKTADFHDDIIDAFAAGLSGDLDSVESFFGL